MSTLLTEQRPSTDLVTDPTPSDGALTRELARVLTVRMLRSPVLWLGVLLSLALTYQASMDRLWALHAASRMLPTWLVPLAAALAIAAWVAATRDERADTHEMIDPTLATPHHRTVAPLVATALTGTVTAAVVSGIALGYLKAVGGSWGPDPLFLAQALVVVLLGGAAGLLVGRWWPNRIGIIGLLAMGGTAEMVTVRRTRMMFRGLSVTNPGEDSRVVELSLFPAGEHLVYLAGLLGLLATVALLRHRRDLTVAIATVVSLVAGVGGWTAMQRVPSHDEIRAKVAMAEQPELVCRTSGSVEACVYPAYTAYADPWLEVGDGVTAALPAGLAVPAAFRLEHQVRSWEVVDDLTAWLSLEEYRETAVEVGADLDGHAPDLDGRTMLVSSFDAHARGSWGDERDVAIAARLVEAAMSLPAGVTVEYEVTQADVDLRERELADGAPYEAFTVGQTLDVEASCSLHGQAREAIGFYLVASAQPRLAGTLERFETQNSMAARQPVWIMQGSWYRPEGASIWTELGRRVGTAMLDLPADRVRSVLEGDLDRWLDGTTPVGDLIAALGLDEASVTAADPDAGAGDVAGSPFAEPITADNAHWMGIPCTGDIADPEPDASAITSYAVGQEYGG